MTPVAADSAPLPSVAAAPARVSLRDFSDRLSPMLVKELRQGLKSHVFTWGLIAMQLSLIIVALLSMEGENVRDINRFFWWSVAGPVCVLLPLRVANALRDETSGNTLDTLLLTQLSAWRITLGKWLATCALQVLVAVTALPYLILRYFAGGVNTPLELAWLGVIVLFGMVVSSIMLGLSWFPYFLVRAIIMLGILFGTAGACGGTIEEISRGDYVLDSLYRDLLWTGFAFFLILAGYLAFFCLDLGAARLAPLSENRATRRRLMALVILVLGGTCCAIRWHQSGVRGSDREIAMVLSMMLGMGLLLPGVQALCERPVNLAPVLMPFMKGGWHRRLAGRFFLPGWHSGVFLMLLLIIAAGALSAWLSMEYWNYRSSRSGYGYGSYSRDDEEMLFTLIQVAAGILGTLVMPLVVWKWTRRMNRWDFWRWLLLILAAGAFHIFIMALGSKTNSKFTYANYIVPSGAFLVYPSVRAQIDDKVTETRPPAMETRILSSRERNLRDERRMRERELVRERLRIQHGIIACISCVLWLGLAVWLACREMRVTDQAWRELT